MRNKKYIFMTVLMILCMTVSTACSNKEDRENEIAYRTVGLNEMDAGAYDDAIEAFDKALALSGGKIGELERDICYYKIDALTATGHINDAIELADSLITYDKNDYRAYLLMGNLKILKKEDDYQDYYKNALKLSGETVEIYSAIYANLSRAGYDSEAAEYLSKALSIKGSEDDDSYLRSMAQMYHISKDYESADILYEKLSEKSPADIANTADCKFWLNDYEGALKLYDEAQESGYETDEKFILGKIVCLEMTGDFAAAEDLMAEYVKTHASDQASLRESIFLDTRATEAAYVSAYKRVQNAKQQEEEDTSDTQENETEG